MTPSDVRSRVTAQLTAFDGPPPAPEVGRPKMDALVDDVYGELRRLAQFYLARERPNHTLQATALVHEVYLKLVDQTRVGWKGRSHFLAIGSQAMRRLLVDHARRGGRDKRGAGWHRVVLDDAVAVDGLERHELLALDEALGKLADLDPRQAQVVELRYFAGMKVKEIAQVLEVSHRTVEVDWAHARAWLRRALQSP